MRTTRVCRAGLLIAATAVVTIGLAGQASAATSPRELVAQLSKQPFNHRLLPGGFKSARYTCRLMADTSPLRPCVKGSPKAVGYVLAGVEGPTTAAVMYTVFSDAAAAHAWFRGTGPEPEFSIWRLKQLHPVSLPHPKISGRIPGYEDSIIVESRGHDRLYRTGTTEFNMLSGNVIVNVTTGSGTDTAHGNRVVAGQLLKAAVARLGAARVSTR